VPAYWLAQVAGGLVGAFAIWGVFGHHAIDLGMGQTSFDSGAYW
jgi:glycerol uptake facilitator-like aquaporin